MHATREVKVGLFVFTVFVLLAVIVFSISDFYSFSPGYRLRVLLNSASGIEAGAPVRLAGVVVGEVRQVTAAVNEAEVKTQAELIIWLKDFAKVEEDAVAYVNTSGLIGERYLEIVPGSRHARLLKDGEVMHGRDTVAMAEFLNTGYEVVAQLSKTISALNSIVGDEEMRAALKGTVTNMQEMTESLKVITERLRRGEGTIGRLLTEDEIYRDLEATVKDVRAHPWKLLVRTRDK